MAASRSRIGSVPYLNAVPLTCGLEDEVTFATPARLAELLREGALDAALVSLAEVLLTDGYDILDGVAIASRGPVRSVFLAHREPLACVRKVHCDTASITSVNLLRVLLAEWGIPATLEPLASYEVAPDLDAVLLIGDRALEFARAGHPHHRWDLGEAWGDLTALPFVYAVWALRRGAHDAALRARLIEARDSGRRDFETLVRQREDFDLEFRRNYLTRSVTFELGEPEKRGIARFAELLRRHALGPVFSPNYVA